MPLDSSPPAAPTGASWQEIGRHAIVQGDCLHVIAGLPDTSIDIVVTSPPYNIGVAYRSYTDRRPRADYLAWMREVGFQLRRVLKPAGSFFLNIGSTNADPWVAMDVAAAFRDLFVLQNHIIWVKSVSVGDDTVGHFKPISSRRFLNQNHESLFHFTAQGDVALDRLAVGVPFKHKSNIARWGHTRDLRCGGNVWLIPYKTVRSKAQKFDHPSGFPLDLPMRCIRLHGVAGARVLDPFMGAGTTLVAAESVGSSAIGIELDPGYAAVAAARLRAVLDRPAPETA